MDLPDSYRIALNKGMNNLAQFLREIDRAEAAGIDVTEMRAAYDFYYDRYKRLKETYFPNKP